MRSWHLPAGKEENWAFLHWKKRRVNNGLRKEGVPRKMWSQALAALLKEGSSGSAHAVIKWGKEK